VEATDETPAPAVNAVPTGQSSTISVSDDYYQTVVIAVLLDILKDQTLSSQHHTVIEAVMSIFKTQGLRCVTLLPQVSGFQMSVHIWLLMSPFAPRLYRHSPQ
jgi:FKBP12-rapamycin complex-associated protein